MCHPQLSLICLALVSMGANSAFAQVSTYTDEAAFMAALTANNLVANFEGFEDNATWGGVRTTISGGPMVAPSVLSQGITWSANNMGSGITTGPGPARTGMYGFFQLPHGNPAQALRDGWVGTSSQPMVAIGGWIKGTWNSVIELRLDGTAMNFNGSNHIGSVPQFFGAISLGGFSQFEWEELEATPGDWKLLFADDFIFSFGGSLIDCNGNGIGDSVDIAVGTSDDCNLNLVPDECEIAAGSMAPGGPFFCASACELDCNNNGLLDACEVAQPQSIFSQNLGPLGDGLPQSFAFGPLAPSVGPVVLRFEVQGNFGGNDEYLSVDLNGTSLGDVFDVSGSDCPGPLWDVDEIVLTAAQFNAALGATGNVLNMVASLEVDANDCPTTSFVRVEVRSQVPSALDMNANGVPDSCESLGSVYCNPAEANTAHLGGARMQAMGSNLAAANNLAFLVEDLPQGQFAMLISGTDSAMVPFPSGSRGILCIGGAIGRHKGNLVFTGTAGQATFPVDLTAIPTPTVPRAILAGDTYFFQAWYRDFEAGVSINNFSDAVEMSFL